MYKMISVIIALNLVLLSASNEGLVKKEINSQNKLPKTEFVSKSDKNIESKLRSKTSARELKLLDLKKVKNNIDLIELKSTEVENLDANSKEIYLQKSEMGHEPSGTMKRPSFIQGPRLTNTTTVFVSSRDGHDSQIFISEYCDYQPGGYSGARFIEVYNPTSQDVVLGDADNSYYFVAKYSNGSTSSYSTGLTGTVAAGDVFVLANNQDKFVEVFGFEADQYSSNISGNGDDVFALSTVGYPASNDEVTAAIFDILGEVGVDGSGTAWDHLDQTIVRNPGYGASATWVADAWSIGAGTTDFATPGTHVFMEEQEGPYLSEGFEGDVFPPAGWENTESYPWQQGLAFSFEGAPDNAYTGLNAVFFDDYSYGTGSVGELVTPGIDLTNATDPKLSFYYYDEGDGDFINVEVASGDFTTFVSIGFTPETTVGWELVQFSLSSYVGEVIKVRFVGTSVWGYSNPHIDDVLVDEPPSVPVAAVSTTAMDFGSVYMSGGSSSLDFTITNNGGADLVGTVSSDNVKFTVSDMPASIAPGEVASITVTYTPTEQGIDQGVITISHNGEPNTDVISVSGTGSPNVLEQNFDGPWTGSPAAPSGWQVIDSDADGITWRQGNTYIPEVDLFAAYGSGNNDDWLISPVIPISGHQLLKWKDVVESVNYPNIFDVYVFPGGVVDVSAAINLGTYNCINTVLTEHAVDLLAYDGTDVRVAFHQTSSLSSGWGFGIDDVTVEPAPAAPILGDLPTNLLFPATVIGESRSTTVSIVNSGVGELSGTIDYSDGFTGPATFATETSVDIAVSYAPTTAGTHSGTVTITSNGGDAVMVVGGNAGGSVATWDDDFDGDGYEDWPIGWEVVDADGSANEWDFYGIGSYARTGLGSAGVRYEFGGAANDDWLISPQFDVVEGDKFIFHASGLSSFYTETFNVMLSTTGTFSTDDVSSFDVTLLSDFVSSSSGDYSTFEIDLSPYVGTQPRIAIQYTATNQYYLFVDDISAPAVYQAAGPLIYDYFSSVDFGTVSAGETGSFVWDYYNTGGSDLEVTAVTFSDGPFSLSTESTLPVITASGGIGSFDVVFSPPADIDAEYSATMTVSHNSGDDIVVSLSGYGLNAVYVESFDPNDDETYSFPDGWQNLEDGDGSNWSVNNYGIYHGYNGSIADNDTALSVAIDLPVVDGYYYELSFSEFNQWGTYAEYCGISITTDGGQTFTPVFESEYQNTTVLSTVDLSGFSGTVHLAFVYIGVDGNNWGVDDIIIKSKPEPIIPILATSSLVFPPTAIGSSSVERLYFMNVGAGTYEGSVTYPDGVTGAASISGLVPGVMDSMDVTYTPTAQGVLVGNVVFDGSVSNAASLSLTVEGNAGAQVATFEDRWIGWDDYSLVGYPSASGTPDSWLWFGGTGHSGPNFAGVYSYTGNWGGVNDFLVSPKLEVVTGDVFSFWSRGGYTVDCEYGETLGINTDSVVVWVSSEKPIMGMNSEGVDTGFVNTSAFTLLGEGKPSCATWDAFSYDLSTYAGDAWLLIQSAKAGWWLNVDDVAYPDMYMNPNPVLYVGTEYDFGVTQPTGDSVRYYLRNTGSQDLIIDDMSFAVGDYFDVDYLGVGNFPVTISPGGIDSIVVYFMPETEGVQTDTLIYSSNYTVGDYDAYGRGTDRSVFIAEAFNAPPPPVALIGPNDGTVLTIDGSNAEGQTGIFWTNSSDPDGYSIEYFLELVIENTGDTLDTLIDQSNFFLSHGEVLEYMTEVNVTQLDISWNVYAYDGFEDVESSNGPWSLTIDGGWALSVDNNTLPEVFALHNNYPNPFNPITNIKYDVPELSDVKIDIYNIAGSKIKTLVSKEHQPGRYKIQWNATNEQGAPVATGMYIYKIRANDFVSVKKLLLMK